MIRPHPRLEQLVREGSAKIDRQSKLRLDINENLTGWPPSVVRTLLSSITPGDLATYPETHRLYSAIARRHRLTPEHVLVSPGSELAIRYVFEAFLAAGTELLILDPSFAMFEVYGRLYGADIVKVPFGSRLEISAADIAARITPNTRIVAIANPNNPTGTALSGPDLTTILERASAVNSLVLVDEAYFYFHRDTVVPQLTAFDNLIVTRTFSKAFGLAGVRIGYALGAPAIIAAVQKAQPIDHVSMFAARFGEYAIDHEELAWEYASQVDEGKAYVVRQLRGMGLPVVDTQANFVLVDLGSDRERVVDALRERALIGTNLRLPFPNDYVKITVGPPAAMEPFVELLRPLLQARARQSITP